MVAKVLQCCANLPVLFHLDAGRFELQVVSLVDAERHFKFCFGRKSDSETLLPREALLYELSGEFGVLSRKEARKAATWVCDVYFESVYDLQLYFLGDVEVTIVVIASLIAVPRLRTDLEKHHLLEVLLVNQRGDFFEDTRERIHHDEESGGALNESLTDVEYTILNLDIKLPVADILD